jgi:hypothetical protein
VSVPTFADRDAARAYIARVLSRPRPPEGEPPKVYLIVYPRLRENAERWAKLEPALRATLRGAELVGYRDVFGRRQRDAAQRIAGIAASCSGALVVPYAWRREDTLRHLIGYPARLEAEGLAAEGVPVLVFTPRGLAAWPDVLVRPAGEPLPPPYLSQEVILPDLPEAPLPTVAASFRALGLQPPARSRPPSPRPGSGRPAPRALVRA